MQEGFFVVPLLTGAPEDEQDLEARHGKCRSPPERHVMTRALALHCRDESAQRVGGVAAAPSVRNTWSTPLTSTKPMLTCRCSHSPRIGEESLDKERVEALREIDRLGRSWPSSDNAARRRERRASNRPRPLDAPTHDCGSRSAGRDADNDLAGIGDRFELRGLGRGGPEHEQLALMLARRGRSRTRRFAPRPTSATSLRPLMYAGRADRPHRRAHVVSGPARGARRGRRLRTATGPRRRPTSLTARPYEYADFEQTRRTSRSRMSLISSAPDLAGVRPVVRSGG